MINLNYLNQRELTVWTQTSFRKCSVMSKTAFRTQSMLILLVLWYCGMQCCLATDVRQSSVKMTMPSCPSQCSCKQTVVQCSKRYQIPSVHKNTTELYMRGNFLGPDINGSVSNLQDLRILDLSENNIRWLERDFLSGLIHLTKLNLSRNSLESLPDNGFSSNSDLEILDLSYNQFYVLPRKAVRFLVHLKKLDFSHNQLISPFLAIQFQVMVRLSVLDLSYNNFQGIPENSFDVVTNWDASIPKYINLSYNNINAVQKHSLDSLRGLREFRLEGNGHMDPESLSLALSEIQNSGIKDLDLSHMNIADLAAVLSNFTESSIETLDISHNSISKLRNNSFDFLVSIKKLDLSRNRIRTLGGGLRDLEYLNYLDISHNKLTSLDRNELSRQSQLRDLILSDNHIINLDKGTLSSLPKLHTLDVSNNNIEVFDLSGNISSSLQNLNLAGNNLLDTGSVINLPRLRILDLSRNKLKNLKAFLLQNSRNIHAVNFSHNHISEINHQVFKPNVPKIIDLSYNYLYTIKNFDWIEATHIYLQGNLIRTIDYQAFYAMNNMQLLDVSGNQIETIEKDTFNYLTNLTTLLLQDNQLTFDPNEASLFRYMSSLRHLDLSDNSISKLRDSTFQRCLKLEFLSLARNEFSTLNIQVISDLLNLKELRLDGNPFRCSCNLIPLKLWLHHLNELKVPWFNQSLLCQSPAARRGTLIRDYRLAEFECNHFLIYLVVICSLVGLGLFVCLLATIVCHYFHRWRKTRTLPDDDETYQYDDTLITDDKYPGDTDSNYGKQDEFIGNSILKVDQCNGYIGFPPKFKGKESKPVSKIKSKLKKKRGMKRSNSVTFGLPISRTADYIMSMDERDWPGSREGSRESRVRRSRSFDLRATGEPFYPPPIGARQQLKERLHPMYGGSLGRRHSAMNGYLPSTRQLQQRRRSTNSYFPHSPLVYEKYPRNVNTYSTVHRQRRPINHGLGDYSDLPLVTYRRRSSNTPIYPGGSMTLPRNIGRHTSMQQISPLGHHGPFTYTNGVIPARVRRTDSLSKIEWV
ncbi:slit homolog 1 protein-like [Liolophura sinensis]|uniref:slit homolog 1 protein-like n=1 Tax=Liolophura sinensis TaxID=3198878 RepID=UPI003158A4A6